MECQAPPARKATLHHQRDCPISLLFRARHGKRLTTISTRNGHNRFDTSYCLNGCASLANCCFRGMRWTTFGFVVWCRCHPGIGGFASNVSNLRRIFFRTNYFNGFKRCCRLRAIQGRRGSARSTHIRRRTRLSRKGERLASKAGEVCPGVAFPRANSLPGITVPRVGGVHEKRCNV